MEQVIYNALFFDTPAGEDSIVKVITNNLDGVEMEMPRALHIVLRAYTLEGSPLPVYRMDGTFIVLMDGTKGSVNLFDGAYTNTVEGTVFESDYVKMWLNDRECCGSDRQEGSAHLAGMDR